MSRYRVDLNTATWRQPYDENLGPSLDEIQDKKRLSWLYDDKAEELDFTGLTDDCGALDI